MRRTTILLTVMMLALLVGSGVALAATVRCTGGECRGTAAADTLIGSEIRDVMYGFNGNDTLNGRGGDDEIYGALHADLLRGGDGLDEIYGGSGNDRLYGEGSSDTIYGGTGADILSGGPGVDEISGGRQNDRINSADGVAEIVDCGLGEDTADVDFDSQGRLLDNVSNCENVF